VILAFASNFWLLLWVLGPASTGTPDAGELKPAVEVDAWFLHTGLFVFYAGGSYLACLGNYFEVRYGSNGHTVRTKHTAFTGVYGFAAAFLVAVYFFDILECAAPPCLLLARALALNMGARCVRGRYEAGQPPALPPWMTQSADVLWMGCVMSISAYLPAEPPLKQTTVPPARVELATSCARATSLLT
jgi:hypothetical protein